MAVTDYRKPSTQLIYDLIEESNPGFKAQYPLDSLQFISVTNVAVDGADPHQNDTQVTCTGVPGSGIIGRVTVKYRRINLTTLFRSVSLILSTYVAGTDPLSRAGWIAEVNARFGVSVQDSDFTAGTYGQLTSGTVYTIPVISTSLCYKGSLSQLQWLRGKRPMSDMFPTQLSKSLLGRFFPGGNDFTTPGRKPVGQWQLYGIDGTGAKATANMESWPASFVLPVGAVAANYAAMITWLNANSGRSDWSTADSATPGGLGGTTWYRYTLPHAAVPEANVERFNRCIVFQSVAGSWFGGKLILHYNV